METRGTARTEERIGAVQPAPVARRLAVPMVWKDQIPEGSPRRTRYLKQASDK